MLPVALPMPVYAEGILYAFEHSNHAGKFVIFLLALGSIFSWSAMISKIIAIRGVRRETRAFLKRFRASKRPISIFQQHETFSGSPSYRVYLAGCRELSLHALGTADPEPTALSRMPDMPKVPATAMSAVKSAMEREVGEQALHLEDRMVLLATAVSGAPFLGLLGTVWGVMDTFADIAAANNANLQTMAPGVSGALITTVMGLLVAIPAMFGYNFLVVTVRRLTVELDNFAAEMAAAIEHRYLDPHK